MTRVQWNRLDITSFQAHSKKIRSEKIKFNIIYLVLIKIASLLSAIRSKDFSSFLPSYEVLIST